VQLSLQPALGPRHHLRLGRALRKLEEDNVLVIGSGHMTHNLRDWMRGSGEPQPYAQEFSDWVRERLEAHELDTLADYRARSPHAPCRSSSRSARRATTTSPSASTARSIPASSRWTPTSSTNSWRHNAAMIIDFDSHLREGYFMDDVYRLEGPYERFRPVRLN